MRIYFLIILTFCIFFGFSQKQTNNLLQLNIGISNGITTLPGTPSSYYKGIQSTGFCYALGAQAPIFSGKKVTIQNALLFKKIGDKSIKLPIDPLRGWWFQRRFSYKLFGFEEQLNLELKLDNKKSLIIGGSFVYYLWGKRTLINLSDGSKIKEKIPKSDMKKFALTLNIGLNTSRGLHPYLQYDFIPTTITDHPVFIDAQRNYLSVGFKLDLELTRGF